MGSHHVWNTIKSASNSCHQLARRGDPFGMSSKPAVADVYIIHPASAIYMQAMQVKGASLAVQSLQRTWEKHLLTPSAMLACHYHTYGRLGKPRLEVLNTLTTTAATGRLIKDTCAASMLRELSIRLCRGMDLGGVACTSGIAFQAKLLRRHQTCCNGQL